MEEAKQKLSFGRKYSIVEFKNIAQDDQIRAIKNPHTGKLFFTCGSKMGAVASSCDHKKRCVVSEVITENGDTFLLLHNEADNNVAFTI